MTYHEIKKPGAIATDSFSLIRQELSTAGYQFTSPNADIIERIIHSTADFDFAETTEISPNAVDAGTKALNMGCPIVCDVNMIRAGISEPRVTNLGGALHCFVAEPTIRQRAEAAGSTRSAMGIRWAAEQGLLEGSLVVVGNAPTALFEAIRLVDEGIRPALIIGVPVGFINTIESKEALTTVTAVPRITTLGRKGGTPVAVAIVNALLRLAVDAPVTEVD